ncbi:hypothetical protein ANAEL_04183 [Anaerolineales bacterium]|nr:hypothetical protein ANAEL_04183 [Anaerolineales bacterium]
MDVKKILVPTLLAFAFFTFACVYIVLPEGLETPEAAVEDVEVKVWKGIVTNVGKSDAGDLHVDIAIRNDTGDWSTMRAVPGKPAILTTGDGKTINCDTVFIGTGGHRLAPGFQMRGYTGGKKDALETQLLYVECAGASADAGSILSIDYVSFGGILDDYDPEANKTEGVLELNLDEVVADLQYPIGSTVDGLILEAGTSITGLSDNVVTLLDVERTDIGFQFTWQNFNPTKFPLKTHIGTPPVIGSDGIIYGFYESLDIVPIPITPPSENTEWTTEVAVPEDVKGFYIMLSVESKKPRTYVNYALDISDK